MRGLSGVVIELTRPGGEYGAGASSVQMALRDLNEGGGITGCKLVTDRRDSQSQGTVASTRRSPLTPNDRNGSWLCENGRGQTALRKLILQMGN
jgi:hypothetical protein